MRFWINSGSRLFLSLGVMLALGACKTEGLESITASIDSFVAGEAKAESFEIVTIDDEGREAAKTASDGDLQKVLQAAVARLRGYSEASIAESIGMATKGQDISPDPALKDFAVSRALVLDDSTENGIRTISGTFDFEDEAGRTAVVGVSAAYRDAGEAVAIQSLDLFPLYLDAPEVALFAAPTEALEELNGKAVTNYASFYEAVQSVALDLHRQSSLPSGAGDYSFVAFVKDRMAPGDRIQMSFAKQRDDATGDSGSSFYRVYEGGWGVGILRRELDLRSGTAGWVKMTFYPRSVEADSSSEPRVVGLFLAGPQRAVAQQSTN